MHRLRTEEGKTLQEIADLFGCSKQAVTGAIASYLTELAKKEPPALDGAGVETSHETGPHSTTSEDTPVSEKSVRNGQQKEV